MRRSNGIFYGWSMVAVAALLMALGVAFLWNSLPVWTTVLRHSFGWSAGQMSWAYSLAQAGVLMTPVVGILVDKLGPRRMVSVGLPVLGVGFVLFSQIKELWQLYAVFTVMGLGSIGCTWLPMMKMLNNWFDRRKTMAMALAAGGFMLSAMLVPLLLAWAIGGTDSQISQRFGWSATALYVGLACLALAFPLSRLVRDRPEDLGLLPDGDALPPNAPVQAASGGYPMPDADWGYSWWEAVRTRDFWLMAIGHAMVLMAMTTLFVHLGLFLDDRGYSLSTIAVALAVLALAGAVLVLVGGYLGDKFAIRNMAFAFSAVLALSVVLLVMTSGTAMLLASAALFGMGSRGPIAMMFSMRGRYFGRKAFGTITGISIFLARIPAVAGPAVAGAVRDATGDYDAAFLGLAAIALVGGVAFLLMGEPSQRSRLLAGDGPVPFGHSVRNL